MSTKKIIAVIGATGNQGHSVADTFLALPNWHVRAITRKPSSETAQALKAKGAEVVQADLEDPSTLPQALAGAHTIFLNTDYWETYRPLKAALEAEKKDIEEASHTAFAHETNNGKNAVDAAAAVSSLERFVVSSLVSTSKLSGGKYTHSLHTESKAWIVDYAEREHAALAAKMSVIILGAYNTNPFLVPRRDPTSGKYMFILPFPKDRKISTVDPRTSTGPFVRALVEDEAPGLKLHAYDGKSTVTEMVDAWSRASGKAAELKFISTQQLQHTMGVGRDHLDAIDALNEFGYANVKGIIEPAQLKTKVQTKSLEQWLQERDWNQVLAE